LAAAEGVKLDVHEHYQKRTFRNRLKLLTSNGVQDWTIPVERRGGRPRSQDETLRIRNDAGLKAWQAVRSAYGRAPYFEEMAEELKEIFLSGPESLGEWNRATMHWAAGWLGAHVPPDADETFGPCPHGFPLSVASMDMFRGQYSWPHVWADRHSGIPFAQLSVLDALVHLGPEASGRIIRIPWNGFPHPK
jgi:hypothetical protein